MKKRDKQPEKIMLYSQRTSGENVNAALDFVKGNWRCWLKYITVFTLPFCIILGMAVDIYIDQMINDGILGELDFFGSVSAMSIYVVALAIVCAVTIALLKMHQQRENGLDGITIKELWPVLRQCLIRIIPSALFATVVIVPLYIFLNVILLFVLPGIGLIVSYCMVLPVLMIPIVYLYESKTEFGESISKGFKLGFSKIIGLGLVGFLILIVSLMAGGALSILYALVMVIKEELFNGYDFMSTLMDLFTHVMCVADTLVMMLGVSINILAVAFHYGSVATEKDDASLEVEISNFEKL